MGAVYLMLRSVVYRVTESVDLRGEVLTVFVGAISIVPRDDRVTLSVDLRGEVLGVLGGVISTVPRLDVYLLLPVPTAGRSEETLLLSLGKDGLSLETVDLPRVYEDEPPLENLLRELWPTFEYLTDPPPLRKFEALLLLLLPTVRSPPRLPLLPRCARLMLQVAAAIRITAANKLYFVEKRIFTLPSYL